MLATDAEEWKNNAASEVHVQRFKENEVGIQKSEGTNHIPCANGSRKLPEDGPTRHTSHASQSYSNFVDISDCLLGEEDDGSDLSKEEQNAMEVKRDL